MWIETLSAKNFRAIRDVKLTFNPLVNVIVGPNGVGKSTILEVIRFAKGLFAPRTQNETLQVLISLRASTPHQPQQLIPAGIANDESKPIEIECIYRLTEEEVSFIEVGIPQITTILVRNRMGFANNPAAFTSYITSPPAQGVLHETEIELRGALNHVKKDRTLTLSAKIDFTTNRFDRASPTSAAFFQHLEQKLPAHLSLFSYFPADRALTPGEQPIQIGMQDAAAQLESHNSQPHTKYARVKNTIFNAVIMNAEERESQLIEFQRIFDGLLRNRRIVGPSVNQYGQLSINIMDTETERVFDIDSMSSGEKNLVLTWLLIARSVAKDGIVLLDEPELHLNPAVCKNILPFLIESYVVPNRIQAIICSHSPEILAGAFSRTECTLFHIRSGDLVTPVRRHDKEELTEALRLLGTSEVEGLLYISTVFVEGEHDVELLEEGFQDLLRRHKVKDLGGRREIEKLIRTMQASERNGDILTPRYFIFDRDDAPTNLQSSDAVRLLQWDRRCLENYLIDVDAICDILKGHDLDGELITNIGQVEKLLRSLALSQVRDEAIRRVYRSYAYKDCGLRSDDIEGDSTDVVADVLIGRIIAAKESISGFDEAIWKAAFLQAVVKEQTILEGEWAKTWETDSDGKKLFKDLQKRVQLGMQMIFFKKLIMRSMARDKSKLWSILNDKLSSLLAP
jgi:predicted ATPase